MAMRYSYKDNFDMLILRHDYMKRINNPDPRWIKEFEPIVVKTSWIMFDKYRPVLTKIGYDIEDVINVTNCYMIAYMSIYSIRRNKEVEDRVREGYKKRVGHYPDEEYMIKKEKINMISFLRQKWQRTSTVCSAKLKNILVDCDRVAIYAYTDKSISVPEHMIFNDGEKFGYRKITKKEMKEIKKTAKLNKASVLKDKNGHGLIYINIPNSGIKTEDYRDLFIETNDDMYHVSPEDSYIKAEEDVNMIYMKGKFDKMSDNQKKKCLVNFIEKNKKNKHYKAELTEARKKLKNL